MTTSISLPRKTLIFGLPTLIILSSFWIINSSAFNAYSNQLSIGITVDLLLTLPLVYFLTIRNTSIPKTTVLPFLILGIVTATLIIPKENQNLLNLFKTWALPIIEIGIFSFIVYKVNSAIKHFKNTKTQSEDFYSVLKNTCNSIFPKIPAKLVTSEVAVFYYGLFHWKKIKLKSNEFSYHKDSGTLGLFIAVLFLIAIETVALHLLISKWSHLTAWILTGISIYSGFQILGFLKSMSKRPIAITETHLYLRYGIMAEVTIDLNNIASIELSSKSYDNDALFKKLSILGDLESHNVILNLKEGITMNGLYGHKKQANRIALFIDEKTEFVNSITSTIN